MGWVSETEVIRIQLSRDEQQKLMKLIKRGRYREASTYYMSSTIPNTQVKATVVLLRALLMKGRAELTDAVIVANSESKIVARGGSKLGSGMMLACSMSNDELARTMSYVGSVHVGLPVTHPASYGGMFMEMLNAIPQYVAAKTSAVDNWGPAYCTLDVWDQTRGSRMPFGMWSASPK